MGTDFSKVRLNGLLDYAGVKLGQGRVLLDGDFNELVDVLDRRVRALASDVLGRATVSGTTPDAFKIEIGGGGLTIGVGRLYVDGLLAECHGADPAVAADRALDDILDEARFANPIPYLEQPYPPQPPALPTVGIHLVYLDVWKREVTHLEQPDLVEKAVGVDTSARDQIVWQVRTLNLGTSGATCASPDGDLPGWADLIAPSTGVLTTDTFEVAPVDDPCELPPTGGYRGLENQLYRVEIHDPGQPGGTATFKWSRENASVGSRVASLISAGEVEVESLGRDDVLSFKTNDWVEFIDDDREFAEHRGVMRKIIVNAAKRRISFAPPLPAAMAPGPFPNSTGPAQRNLRVRRWDQKGEVFRTDPGGPVKDQDVGPSGLIKVPAATTTLILENGVTVQFDSTGAKGFRSGDHWVFAARTADASVEKLDRALPRAIWHNYARLAIWDAGAGTVTDCRNKWPPRGGDDCSCTACVTAESHASGAFTIQDAVDKVKPTGGTVCIGPGQYLLAAPVRIDGAISLNVRGQGLASMIVATAGAFEISGSFLAGIENIGIVSVGEPPAIRVDSAIGLSLRQIAALVIGGDEGTGVAISLEGAVAAATIADNVIFAATGILANALPPVSTEGAAGGELTILLTAALAIDDNIFLSERSAVTLDGNVMHLLGTRITGNEIVGCRNAAISTLGFAFDLSSMRISRNDLSVAGIGIRCGVEGISIDGNKLISSGDRIDPPPNAIMLAPGGEAEGIGQCHILANQITGFGGTGIHIGTPVEALIVKQNIIEACGQGIVSDPGEKAGKLTIENNQLLDIGQVELPLAETLGIGVVQADSATIAGNSIRAFARDQAGTGLRAAILTRHVERARILGNEATDIGPAGQFGGQAIGIALIGSLADFEVSHNRVERDSLVSPDIAAAGEWMALFVGPAVIPAAAPGNVLTLANNNPAAMRISAGGRVTVGDLRFLAAAPLLPSGSILGNVFNARGTRPAVQAATTECLFNDNRVEALIDLAPGGGGGLSSTALPALPAVALAAQVPIVSANWVRGGRPSILVSTAPNRPAAVLGNITSSGITVTGGLGAPFVPLNLIA